MRIFSKTLFIFLAMSFINVSAEGDLTRQEPIEVTVKLGTSDSPLAFHPSSFRFETGKLYKLILRNESNVKHYFVSEKFTNAIFSRKVQVMGPDGNRISEVKGIIKQVEVDPGGVVEWWFVPVQTVEANDLKCTVKGHAKAGMIGKIILY